MVARVLRLSLLCLALAVLLGASPVHGEDLSGVWEGRWVSDTTGHQGPLRATLTKLNESQYLAQFSGRFLLIVPFRYSLVLNVVAEGDAVYLAGQKTLGRRYGTFTYEATATACQFTADYRSCKDCGQFVLTRCCRTPAPCCP